VARPSPILLQRVSMGGACKEHAYESAATQRCNAHALRRHNNLLKVDVALGALRHPLTESDSHSQKKLVQSEWCMASLGKIFLSVLLTRPCRHLNKDTIC